MFWGSLTSACFSGFVYQTQEAGWKKTLMVVQHDGHADDEVTGMYWIKAGKVTSEVEELDERFVVREHREHLLLVSLKIATLDMISF
ncbi:hypothetical protein ETB97_011402 [Aspergillus alliaceus]|uniref:Uncharacterized protein n=1 Tax=Petromyces alliaceus TaxID=209559 RepID=A0A8H6AFP6_PETAA|nr:hypothetical protein ETB97_011402 [Aspergillus burnettii]